LLQQGNHCAGNRNRQRRPLHRQIDDTGCWRGAGRIDGVPAAILVAHAQAGEQDGVVADARALGICEPKGAIADPAHGRF
jgi:hypothetical protein